MEARNAAKGRTVRRPFRSEMPVTLTLPLGLERRPRARSARFRRALLLVFVALGLVLLGVGLWLPANAEPGSTTAPPLLQSASWPNERSY